MLFTLKKSFITTTPVSLTATALTSSINVSVSLSLLNRDKQQQQQLEFPLTTASGGQQPTIKPQQQQKPLHLPQTGQMLKQIFLLAL
ncbi:hypothetical protein CVS40_1958 [Lucilia cuprina]|nr:hypothetical protein CVS40_1958 [Lucilia cuprina]